MNVYEHDNSNKVNIASNPVKLADLVQYQPGSIVSREILRAPTGTITIFALDAGQGLSEHTAPFDAILYVIDGEGEITIGGVSMNVKTGEIVLMPANIPHAVRANVAFKMLLIMIRS